MNIFYLKQKRVGREQNSREKEKEREKKERQSIAGKGYGNGKKLDHWSIYLLWIEKG